MLRGRRVLLEPASKELRFVDGALEPRIELDLANNRSVRIRVVFELGNRRFPLSSGAWFEGTPGWHIDTTEGVARPVSSSVTPGVAAAAVPLAGAGAADDRSAAPARRVHPARRGLARHRAAGPEPGRRRARRDAQVLDPRDAATSSKRARALKVQYDQFEYDVPPAGFPQPLAFQTPSARRGAADRGAARRGRRARRRAAADEPGLRRRRGRRGAGGQGGRGDSRSGPRASASLPAEWERFIPNDLVGVTVRDKAVTTRARVSSGVDWLSLDMTFEVDGVGADERELRECLESGRRLVRLQDGTYAPVKTEEVSRDPRAHGRDLRDQRQRQAAARAGGTHPGPALAGRQHARHAGGQAALRQAAETSPRSSRSPSRARSRPRCAPTRRKASRGSCSCTS